MKVFEFLDRWMFETYRPCAKGLPYFRVLFAIYLLTFYLPADGWLGGMPNSFYHPKLSLAVLFTTLPPPWFFYGLDLAMEFGAVCLLVGRWTRPVTFLLCAGLIVGNSFRYSIGPKIDHDILVVATLFCLGFSGWGDRFSRDECRRARTFHSQNSAAWPIALLMLIVSFCMLTASLPKASSGWADPHVLACRGQIINNYLQSNRPTALADFLLNIHSTLFWKLADYSTLVIESAFILCIFSLTAMRLVVTFAIFFHAFVYFSMDILFVFNIVTYACLLDLRFCLGRVWVRRLARRFQAISQGAGVIALLVSSFCLVMVFYTLRLFEIYSTSARDCVTVVAALFVAVISLTYFLGQFADRLVFGHAFPLGSDHSMIILYDGECGLCDRWIQFVLRHDPRGLVSFAPLQSGRGKELLAESGSAATDLSTMVFLVDRQPYFRSTAALMILRQIGGVCALTGALGFIPASMRDVVYNFVAVNRHRWFPRTGESCLLPTPRERVRFLA